MINNSVNKKKTTIKTSAIETKLFTPIFYFLSIRELIFLQINFIFINYSSVLDNIFRWSQKRSRVEIA
jgi:hypothetical protein